jgi:prophage regulatory protein
MPRPEVSGRKLFSAPSSPGRTLIRLKVVVQRAGLPISSIYEMMDSDEFPHSVPLSDRRVAWIEDEIDGWIAARIAERDEKLERIPLIRDR